MQDSKFGNLGNMFSYREWNSEMRALYNKYSLVRELNHDLMKELPVYAMYTISEHCRRLKNDTESQLIDYRCEKMKEFKGQPEAYVELVSLLDTTTYDTLKPVLEDYMTARCYYLAAMYKSEEEYKAYLAGREERFTQGQNTK